MALGYAQVAYISLKFVNLQTLKFSLTFFGRFSKFRKNIYELIRSSFVNLYVCLSGFKLAAQYLLCYGLKAFFHILHKIFSISGLNIIHLSIIKLKNLLPFFIFVL